MRSMWSQLARKESPRPDQAIWCDTVTDTHPRFRPLSPPKHQPPPNNVMVSSTFTDLDQHRAALFTEIHTAKLNAYTIRTFKVGQDHILCADS